MIGTLWDLEVFQKVWCPQTLVYLIRESDVDMMFEGRDPLLYLMKSKS